MGVFEQFPYSNFHELNADWLMKELLKLKTSVEQFVAINALKYADPIQWSIVRQYEKNTIVIDPLTGTAYISVQPVPSGVALTRTEYWTVVFDLGSFVVRAAKNFTNKFEEDTTLTATFPSNVNDWLIWGDTLYRVISNIVAGDQYVVGSNIQHFTIEDVIGHLEDLTTSDKSNVVAAINEVMTIIGSLTDLTTADNSNIVAAINEVVSDISDIKDFIGSDTLETTAQTLTGAINENYESIEKYKKIITPEMFGAVGDGVADDTVALQDAIDAAITGHLQLIARGKIYKTTSTLNVHGYRDPNTLVVESGDNFNIDFSCTTINYTGNDYAFDLSMLVRGDFKFGYIIADNGGGIKLDTPDRFHVIAYVNIEGHEINCLNKCIYVINQSTGWCNQIRVRNIKFSGGTYALHIENYSTNPIDEWLVSDNSIEGVDEGILIETHSENDINIYANGLAFEHNRILEHVSQGKHYILSIGRVNNVIVVGTTRGNNSMAAYQFDYDPSGNTSYTHIMSNMKIYTPFTVISIMNGKQVNNPQILKGSEGVENGANATSLDDFLHATYHSPKSDFTSLDPTLSDYTQDISSTTQFITDVDWFGGAVTGAVNDAIIKMKGMFGIELIKPIIGGTTQNYWLRNFIGLSERRNPLHDTDISFPMNSACLLVIHTNSFSYREVYLVRFGVTTAPPTVLIADPTNPATITQVDNRTIHYENSAYPSTAMHYCLIPLGA